jgi:hypothetical protein
MCILGKAHNVFADTAEVCAQQLNDLCEEHEYPLLNPDLCGIESDQVKIFKIFFINH